MKKIWVESKFIIIIISIVLILYFLNRIFQKFKSGDTKELDQALKNAEKDDKQESYYNDAQLKGFAESIYTMLEHGGFISNMFQDDNESGVVSIMMQMQTTGDVLKVSRFLTAKYQLNLQSMLRDELEMEDIDKINSYYDSKGIVFNI